MDLPLEPFQPILSASDRLIPALRHLDERDGKAVYVVGGCIRDALLLRKISDVDLAVDGDGIASARRLADDTRGAFVPLDETTRTGRAVLHRNWTIDITSLRGGGIEQDLACRDFTINAMAVPLSELLAGRPTLIDPFHGCDDLAAHRLRALSEQAFVDDPLRLLRAFRFAVVLKLEIDAETLVWIRRQAPLLPTVSAERIQEELAAFFSANGYRPFLPLLWDSGVLPAILPKKTALSTGREPVFGVVEGINRLLDGVAGEDPLALRMPLAHLAELRVCGNRTWIWLLHLAATLLDLMGDSDLLEQTSESYPRSDRLSEVEGVLQGSLKPWTSELATANLRLSNRERQALLCLTLWPVRLIEMDSEGGASDDRLYDIARDAHAELPGAVALTWSLAAKGGRATASLSAQLARLLWIQGRRRSLSAEPPLLTGVDLMETCHLAPGPILGYLLATIERHRTLNRLSTREEAIDLALRLLAEQST